MFRAHTIASVLAYVGDAGELVKRAGLPAGAATAPWVDLSLDRLARFYELAAEAAGDPLLGVHVGLELSRAPWDVMQLSCLSAPTLRRALALLPRLIPLFNDAVELRCSGDAGGPVTVEHRVAGHADGLSRHGNELWMAALLGRARDATGAPVTPTTCWFAHAAPPTPSARAALTRALGIPAPAFGAGATGLTFAAADADRPLRTSDPVLLGVLDRLVEPRLAVVGERRGVAAEVCRAIEAGLGETVPELRDVARQLARSTRALQRELAEAGTSYRALIDQVRRARARAAGRRHTPRRRRRAARILRALGLHPRLHPLGPARRLARAVTRPACRVAPGRRGSGTVGSCAPPSSPSSSSPGSSGPRGPTTPTTSSASASWAWPASCASTPAATCSPTSAA